MAQAVVPHIEAGVLAAEGLLAIDNAVDGIGGLASPIAQHLGGSSCWRQEDHGPMQLHQTAHDGAHEGRLARSRIAAQEEGIGPLGIGHEVGQTGCCHSLVGRESVGKLAGQ